MAHATMPGKDIPRSAEGAPTTPADTGDGTRQLLQSGFWILVAGVAAAAATDHVFGGIGIHGPHTNAGWISLMVSLMCLPFGAMLFLLGGAKWLRNRRLAKAKERAGQ